jgi:hypothetical protein
VNDSAWPANFLRSAAICAHNSDPMATGRSAALGDLAWILVGLE